MEVDPTKFLDTNMQIVNNQVITSVHRKQNKVPTHWSSKIPKRYKRNKVNEDWNRSHKISMNFEQEKI